MEATRTQQELSASFLPCRSQWNWTFTRPYLSVKISSPDGPTTTAVWVPGTTGLGDWKTYATREVNDKSVGRWKALSPWTVRRLAAIVNPLAAELGYEPLPEGPAAPSADDRRAEELGRLIAGMKMKMGGSPAAPQGG